LITRIILKNFKSFKNKTIIDVNETNYKMLSNTNTFNGVLKGLLFVGANASGKTNAVSSILFLLELLFGNIYINILDYFCFYPSSDEMQLDFTFKINNDEIIYGFSFNQTGYVQKEYLYSKENKI
jgi:AAA15 family ATPase/GTPase